MNVQFLDDLHQALNQTALVAAFDPDGRITEANNKLLQVFGFVKEELIGKPWSFLLSESCAELRKEALASFSKGQAWKGSICHQNKGGQLLWTESTVQPVFTKQGQLSRFIYIAFDITDQKRNEEVIEQQRAHMISSAKLSTLGEMAGSIAHEINNPVAIIMGSAELLSSQIESSKADPARLSRLTNTIVDTAARIANIVKSLHFLARDGEHDPLEEKPLEGIFSSVLEMCSAKARSHQIQLKVDRFSPSVAIYCRPTQIAQALLNLINNSLSAVSNLETKWVELEVRDRHASVEIWITDSGHGIPKSEQEKIFHPFFTTKQASKSVGLGLSVAAGFIETHGGTIHLDSECANTRFVITLPKRLELQPSLTA